MPGDLDDLAGALADGDDIDWAAAHARLTSSDSRSVVEGLESISRLSAVPPGDARPSRRLPLLLEAAQLLSVGYCVAGLAGFAMSFEPRDAVVLGVLVTFAGAASFLDVAGRDRRTRALAACFWTTAGAFASRGIVKLSGHFPGTALLPALLTLRPDAFFSLAVWQFARDFPSITRFGSVDVLCVWGVRAATATGAVFFGASVLPLLLPASDPAVALAPSRSAGPPSTLLFAMLVFGGALTALMVMFWRSRLAEGVERARVRLFLYAIVISLGPMMTVIVAATLWPPLWRSLQSPQGFARSAWIVYPPMFLFPVATAYAVASRDVLNVRLVIQRSARYLLARWLLLWGALVPLGLLVGHLYRHTNLTLGQALTTEPAPVLLWFAGVGAIVLAFRGTLIRALDQWALPGVEAPAAALAAMTERMKQARTPLEVAVTLAEAIERAMQTPTAAYLFIGEAIVPADGGAPALPSESAIPALLEGAREPAVVSATHRRSYYSLLLGTDREWIDHRQIEVIVPVLPGRSGSGLLGLVTLSARRNALGFSDDDIRFVRVAAAAASLACDAIGSGGRPAADADPALDEVALQCQRCGRIEERAAGTPACACHGAWQPAALPKRVIGRFELREWLGTGGMGVVYRASDLSLARDVALKTLPRLSDGAAERLMTEARTMASLSHEDVAVVFGVEQWRGTPLLVMEYLPGGTLAAQLRRGKLSEAEVVALVRQVARSLARVHGRGLYHGDIKPSNIGIASGGAAKLLDFGLARALSVDARAAHEAESDTERPPLGGTWAYLPLEIRDGAAPPGPSLDLWALGVVLCEGLLGAHPFPHARTRYEMTSGLLAARTRLRVERSPGHERVVASMLSLEPRERPATAAAFEQLLSDLS